MTDAIDDRDRLLLRTIQDGLPLEGRPFQAVADRMGWSEEEVLVRLGRMVGSGLVRKVGAVLDSRMMAAASLLAAVDIPEERVDDVAAVINAYPGVTHNYLREGHPNVWFTLTERDSETLEANLAGIEEGIGARVIRMPATKMFKIGVRLDI